MSKKQILKSLHYIESHLEEPLNLEQVAKIAAFSKYHFSRVFESHVGENPAAYIRRLRLEKAAGHLLLLPSQITDVALYAGYKTPAAFTYAFRQRFGTPPSTFVHAHKYNTTEENTPMQALIEHKEDFDVYFVRTTGPYPLSAKAAWTLMRKWAGPKGLMNGKNPMIGIARDNPDITDPEKNRYDACLPVGNSHYTPEGEISIQTIQGGRYACFIHTGPYEKIKETYRAIYGNWLEESKETLRDAPGFVIYRNDPRTTPEEKRELGIYIPLA